MSATLCKESDGLIATLIHPVHGETTEVRCAKCGAMVKVLRDAHHKPAVQQEIHRAWLGHVKGVEGDFQI